MLMVIFLLGIALLMLMIIKFKINPFLALIGTSILIGFGAFVLMSLIDLEGLRNRWKNFVIVNICLQLLLFTPLGMEVNGQRAWLNLGVTSLQPGELGKLIFIFTMAAHISEVGEYISELRGLAVIALHTLIMMAAVVVSSGDSGMAIQYFMIAVIMLFAAGLSLKWIALGAGVAVAGAFSLVRFRSGYAMADLQRRCAEFSTPENEDGLAVITGKAPVAEMRGCAREVTAYTRGAGRLSCMPRGYAPCHNTEAVLEAIGYQPDADTENPADSVFCSHGAGYLVKWGEVPAHAHVASGLGRNAPGAQQAKQEEADASDEASDARRRAAAYCGTLEQDKELLAIFERTYGPIKRRGEAAGQHDQLAARKAFRSVGPSQNRTPAAPPPSGPEYLLVDGYNVIFAWDELKKIAAENLDAARRRLMDILCNYAGYRKCVPILVFDAYRVKGAGREQETWHNLHVIYTREAETADMFIERATHELAKNHRVRVVSSDGAEQIIILGNGALRVSARAFEREVRAVEAEIREFLDQ